MTIRTAYARFVLVLAALAFGLVAPAHAVTTNTYSASSTSDDITKSCKDLSIVSTGTGEGTLTATCNNAADAPLPTTTSTIALEPLVYCEVYNGAPYLYWGTTSFNGHVTGWSVSVSSSGKKYYAGATCNMGYTSGSDRLDIGQTGTSARAGLKNNAGSLEKR